MSINIKDYEMKLQNYTNIIKTEKERVADAERDLLISQTHLENYEAQMKTLEEECKNLTGKSVSEIETVISDNMIELDKVMAKINQTSTIVPNVHTMSEQDLMAAMQFGPEE